MPMSIRSIILAAATVFAWHAATATATPESADSRVLDSQELVEKSGQEAWVASWWQWSTALSDANSPTMDTTGEHCNVGQHGSVWFLAGTAGGVTHRTCVVPRDRILFVPVVGMSNTKTAGTRADCAALTASVEGALSGHRDVVLTVDGKPVDLASHWLRTSICFDKGAMLSPPVNLFPTTAAGYYVMLRPLLPGEHSIAFGSKQGEWGVVYKLLVSKDANFAGARSPGEQEPDVQADFRHRSLAKPAQMLNDTCGTERPPASIRNEEYGSVQVGVIISEAGDAMRTQVVKSSGYPTLDEGTAQLIAKCRFRPGTDPDGKPINSMTVVQWNWPK